jgi:hypothetical protein
MYLQRVGRTTGITRSSGMLSWLVSGYLRPTSGGTIGARSDFKVMIRPSCRRSKLTFKPCIRSWGASRRSSLPNFSVVLGQSADAATFLPTISVSLAYSLLGVSDNPGISLATRSKTFPRGESSRPVRVASLRLSV